MDKLTVIKIGGNVIDAENTLNDFLHSFAGLPGKKILVHGGGKLATRLATQLQLPQQLVEGRRITDAETLKIVTMVYAGYINKNMVARLQAEGSNAIGLCGADGNAVRAHQRQHATLDYGFVGDVDGVNESLLGDLLDRGMIPVIAPVTHNGKGQLLNTNADTMAQEIAVALSHRYETSLVFTFEKAGVLRDVNDESTLVKTLTRSDYFSMKSVPGEKEGAISAGMIPKLDNAFHALEKGVKQVMIGKAEEIASLFAGHGGTRIVHG